VCAVLSHAPADAQGPRERALGRELFREGVALARNGDWTAARDRFARAHELTQQPTILINLAAAEAQLGRLVEASDSYRRFLASEEPRRDLQRAAEEALEALEPRIARLTVRVTRAERGDEVVLDGRALSRAALDTPIPVNPGTHRVAVMRAGIEVGSAEIAVAEGAREVLSVEASTGSARVPAPDEVELASGPAERSETRVEDDERGGGAAWLPWAVIGAIVVGAVIAGVLIFSGGDEPAAIPQGYEGSLGLWRPADGTSGNLGTFAP